MPLQIEPIEEPSLNLTSMLDVVLLLVIFFMVGTQFADEDERKYEIQLPTVTQAQPLTGTPDEIVVNVRKDGQIFVGSREVTPEQLTNELREARRNYARQTVIVRGDADGPYQHVMTVIGVCRQVQITNIQLANRVDSGGGA